MIVSLQYLTVSWIKISKKSLILVYQLSRNSWFWFPMMNSSSGFNYLGINSAWIHCNRNNFCDSYLAFLSFGRFSFSATCSFFLSQKIGALRKFWIENSGWQGLLGFCFRSPDILKAVDSFVCSILRLFWKCWKTLFESHYQLQVSLDFGLLKHVSLWRFD